MAEVYATNILGAGWSSPVARQAHNLKVVGSNPTPATKCLISMGYDPVHENKLPYHVPVYCTFLDMDTTLGELLAISILFP